MKKLIKFVVKTSYAQPHEPLNKRNFHAEFGLYSHATQCEIENEKLKITLYHK